MTRVILGALGVALLSLGVAADDTGPKRVQKPADPRVPSRVERPAMAVAHDTGVLSTESQNALIKQYCVACHNDRMKTGGLTLAAFDATQAVEHADLSEKMIRKLRAGMMPPPGVKRPDAATLTALAVALETPIDAAAAARPNPGWRPFQRLNRAEYTRAVRDLIDIDVDVTAFLPPDTVSHGFDNIADVQSFSPTLMEGYLRAASKISSLAVGDRTASSSSTTYKVRRTASQMNHVEGAPLGTRGGISVVHTFPADGEYSFRMMLHSIPTGQLFGSTVRGEQIEVSINGERVALLDINPRMSETDPNGMNLQTTPVHVNAGPQRVSAAFIQRFEAPVDDLIAPIEHTLADTNIGSGYGITTLPHLRDFAIMGPHQVTGVSDTPTRRRIFTCRPTTAAEEAACARDILTRLAARAYRGPLVAEDLDGLVGFYEKGRRDGDFESGIRMALQAILASPRFLFRLEEAPASLRAGQTYPVNDMDLASRLSFFLWGTAPDAALVKAAAQGTLRTPAVLEKQVRRMLADPRSEALATRFAAQWLRLQDLEKIHPDALLYPLYDATLGEALKRETELFFDSIVREDRSVLDLLTADYTFVNERVAKHYGIPNVSGPAFRRVTLADDQRRGILGHGSVLTLTSVADRTSAVQRGKWIMEVLLGTSPPPPPPNVPALEDTKAVAGTKLLSVRERMEAHRSNPACTSCHKVIDPLGLALENFDVTGAWRIKDNGQPVDASGVLYDGTTMNGPADLRAALVKHSDIFLTTFTESLMTYALGRRVEPFDMPTVRAIVRDAAKNDHRISSFIMGVVKSPAFRMSRAETPVTTDFARR
jgi:cytochrome c551/c552